MFGAVREQIICYACTYTHLFLTYIPGKTKSAHHSVFAAFHTHLQASVTHWDMSWESNTSLCDEAGPGINVKPKKKKVLLWEMCFFFFFFSLPLLTCTTNVLQAIFTDVLSLRGTSHRAVGYSQNIILFTPLSSGYYLQSQSDILVWGTWMCASNYYKNNLIRLIYREHCKCFKFVSAPWLL